RCCLVYACQRAGSRWYAGHVGGYGVFREFREHREGLRPSALPVGAAPATADITVAHLAADNLSLPGFQERFKGYRKLPSSGPEGQSRSSRRLPFRTGPALDMLGEAR